MTTKREDNGIDSLMGNVQLKQHTERMDYKNPADCLHNNSGPDDSLGVGYASTTPERCYDCNTLRY